MQDDPTILAEDPLWRRVHWSQVILDKNLGRRRPTSAAFTNSSDGSGMSVVLGKDAEAEGREPASILRSDPGLGVVSVKAGICRGYRQIVARDPLESEPHHAVVEGDKPRSVQSALAKAATIVIDPQPASG